MTSQQPMTATDLGGQLAEGRVKVGRKYRKCTEVQKYRSTEVQKLVIFRVG